MPKAIAPAKDTLPLMLRMAEVQQVLRLSRERTYRLPHQKGFPVLKFGRALRVPRDAFLRWVEEQSQGGEK